MPQPTLDAAFAARRRRRLGLGLGFALALLGIILAQGLGERARVVLHRLVLSSGSCSRRHSRVYPRLAPKLVLMSSASWRCTRSRSRSTCSITTANSRRASGRRARHRAHAPRRPSACRRSASRPSAIRSTPPGRLCATARRGPGARPGLLMPLPHPQSLVTPLLTAARLLYSPRAGATGPAEYRLDRSRVGPHGAR
jgi:hypothetical protein